MRKVRARECLVTPPAARCDPPVFARAGCPAFIVAGLLIVWTGCASRGTGGAAPSYPHHHDPTNVAGTGRKVGATPPSGDSDRLTVNAESITASGLVRDAGEEWEVKAKSLPPEAFRAYVERRAMELISDRIAETLLYQRAKGRLPAESNRKVESFVDAEIRRIVSTQYDGVLLRFEKHLASQGRTLEDARERIRRDIIVASFLEEQIKPKVGEPTRAELFAAFESNVDSFRRPERRQMSLIEVRVGARNNDRENSSSNGSSADPRAAAFERARAAQNELRNGYAFAEVARRYSDGAHADEGGSWGWVMRDSVRERYAPVVDALYRLQAGEVSDLLEPADAFFLVRCDAIEPGIEPKFPSLQPQLRERWIREKYNRWILELVNDLRRDARLEPSQVEQFHAAVVKRALELIPAAGG